MDHARALKDSLVAHGKRWAACRRWYKWLSVIQLVMANVLALIAVVFIGLGVGFMTTGTCCHETGESQGKTVIVTTNSDGSKTKREQDNGTMAKCCGCMLRFIGAIIFAGGLVAFCGSHVMLFLSFVTCYEEVDVDAPLEHWRLKNEENIPEAVPITIEMNRFSKVLGYASKNTVFAGRMVYTGWIQTDHGWIKCRSQFGKMLFEKVDVPGPNDVEKGVSDVKGKDLSDNPIRPSSVSRRSAELNSSNTILQPGTVTEVDGMPVATEVSDVPMVEAHVVGDA